MTVIDDVGAGEGDPVDEQLERFRQELADTPAEVVVANHGYGLFELAALHLSLEPPRLAAAQLAIDGLTGLLAALTGRLGRDEPELKDRLAQLKLAMVRSGTV